MAELAGLQRSSNPLALALHEAVAVAAPAQSGTLTCWLAHPSHDNLHCVVLHMRREHCLSSEMALLPRAQQAQCPPAKGRAGAAATRATPGEGFLDSASGRAIIVILL